ncbi:MAG: DEAD/DEAH box helicase [Planctomycetes bacterium]|nr:DEAD/DEAH box helicase [Planctomycetota bacterium]
MNCFSELPLAEPILKAVSAEGYTTPTPIQAKSITHLVEGRDLLGCAQTGTGKTAAFALPILHRLDAFPLASKRRVIRALVLTPTRELAAQIVESFRTYGKNLPFRTIAVYGGVGRGGQAQKLMAGVDILVATPGRLLDFMNTGEIDLKSLEIFVLDEADRMLDMGFIHDVRRVISALPKKRQSLFFSATMPKAVAELASGLLADPVKVEVAPQATPAERIRQSVLFVDKNSKDSLLEEILRDQRFERVLVFTRTKHRADRVARKLSKLNIPADAIHGNKAQNARTRALAAFRNGDVRVLVATDIAARGIDIDGITHVINYELPNEPESYVHRIGRTARAGNDGRAISFCSGDERDYLASIEKTMRLGIKVVRNHPCHSEEAERGMVDGEDGGETRKRKAADRQAGDSAPRKERREPRQSRPAAPRGTSGGRRRHQGR